MGNMYSIIESLCKDKGTNITRMCREAKIPRSVFSELKAGRTKQLSNKYLPVVANYFNVSVDYLIGNVNDPFFRLDNKKILKEINSYENSEEEQKETPTLTKKDERDISKKMQETLAQLEEQQSGLMFDGEPLDDETKELLAISLKNSLELAKKIAKQKYTPKKYRKKSE